MNKVNKEIIFASIKTIGTFIVVLWVIFFVSKLFNFRYGISPRSVAGLPGIFLAPFFHKNLQHIVSNSITLFFLGTLVLSLERRRFLMISFFIILGSGIGIWIFGRANIGGYKTAHMGISGLIYGYLGYAMALGIFKRKVVPVIISIIVFLLYGGALWGIVPGNPLISWEGHLFGLLSGIGMARFNYK
ncbi:MAG: rhomboid family intramembrane serine protease [bacterium]|nr:rhomboid family intramembrane serine protease [bacterium]